VTAVTTSDRVAAFFERNGFERVGADEIPAEKWQGYDPERRARAVCLRRVL
jgi:amino-acid N-acetyltransferase